MLTLICGLPRAGKTTYSKQFNNVIHLDTSGAYPGVIRRIKREKIEDIIVEGVYSRSKERVVLINAYCGSGLKCIWLNTSDNIRRSRPGWDKWCDKPFEPPTYEEGWDEIIIIKDNKDIQYLPKDKIK